MGLVIKCLFFVRREKEKIKAARAFIFNFERAIGYQEEMQIVPSKDMHGLKVNKRDFRKRCEIF